jgi:ABC-type transport system involved in Fe-S cluster assembly fused permease/ATPase subunit
VLKKILGVIVGIGAMVIGLMFFMVAFSVIIVVALLVWAYFWWKTRKLRSAMRAQQSTAPASGNVFEGEAVVVREYTVDTTNLLPGDARKDPPAPHQQ